MSDRIDNWTDNFRNPDMAYFSNKCKAVDLGTHWEGGPDFLVEVISPDDVSHDKLPFYATIGTREVLILDRDPWQIELYRRRRNRMELTGTAKSGDKSIVTSEVVPLSFALIRGRPRPKIRITHTETA